MANDPSHNADDDAATNRRVVPPHPSSQVTGLSGRTVWHRTQRTWQSLRDWLWGYDFFISYHWASGGSYAVNLAQRLREKRYEVFLDRAEYAMGDDWPTVGRRALDNTTRLVLIATRQAVTISQPVEREITRFTSRSSQVIPIVFGDRFVDLIRDDYPVLRQIKDTQLFIEECAANLARGPAEATIEQLIRTQRVMRRRNLRALLAVIPAVAVILFASWATISRGQAVSAAIAARGSEAAEKSERIAATLARDQARLARDAAKNELARAQFALGRLPFEQHKVDEALLWWAKSCSTSRDSAWRIGMTNLIGAWSSTQPRRMPHRGRVIAISFSPDGLRVLTGGDSTVQIWDSRTGTPIGKPMRHDGLVAAATFSPDGHVILTGSNAIRTGESGEVRLWNGFTGEPMGAARKHAGQLSGVIINSAGQAALSWGKDSAQVWDLRAAELSELALHHGGTLTAALFSPDNDTVLTTGYDGSAKLWDVRTGLQRGDTIQHDRQIRQAVFSSDGSTVITGSDDSTARLWNAQTGRSLGEPMRHNWSVSVVAISPDGMSAITGSEAGQTGKRGEIKLWDVRTGAQLGESLEQEGNLSAVAFSADGQTLVAGNDMLWVKGSAEARLWDARTGLPIGDPMRHDGKSVSMVKFSADGRTIFTVGDDRTVRMWEARTGASRGQPLRHESLVSNMSFSADCQQVLTASADAALLWNAHADSRQCEPMRHQRLLHSVARMEPDGRVVRSEVGIGRLTIAFSGDGRLILTGSNDTTAHLWDAVTGRARGEPLEHADGVTAVAFNPRGRTVLTASDKAVHVWDIETGQQCASPMTHAGFVSDVAFSPDGTRILTGSMDQTARLWNADTGTPLGTPMIHTEAVSTVAFSPDGKSAITVSGKTVRMWDAASGVSRAIELPHAANVSAIAFSPDGEMVLTGCEDKTARLWEAQSGKPRGEPMAHHDQVSAVAFSPDGSMVLTACNSTQTGKHGEARRWDARTGVALGEPFQHEQFVNVVAFSPDGLNVLTGSSDNTAKLWDVQTGIQRGRAFEHGDQVRIARFSPDGRTVLTGGADNVAQLWTVPPPAIDNPEHDDHLSLSMEVRTGKWVDGNGMIQRLSFDEWMQRTRRLEKMGGSRETPTWDEFHSGKSKQRE